MHTAVEVIEPISVYLVSAICDSTRQMPVSRETVIANSQSNVSSNVIREICVIFSQTRHHVADPLAL